MKAAWLLAFALLAGCAQDEAPPAPRDLTRATVCALDGMTLLDYPGPKGQIHYAGGESEFFCDTMELVAMLLVPEQKKKVLAAYTQDMARADWKNPVGYWIEAQSAYYVIEGKLKGAMGPTFATFAQQQDAEAFSKRNGGRVLRYSDLTPEMVNLDGGVMKDERM